MLETPLDMVLSMLRSVGVPLDPLTIEGLESNIRDDDISYVWEKDCCQRMHVLPPCPRLGFVTPVAHPYLAVPTPCGSYAWSPPARSSDALTSLPPSSW